MYYIGLMSGTSADGVDAALVDFATTTPQLVGHTHIPFPEALQTQIVALYTPNENEIDRLGGITHEVSEYYTQAVECLLDQSGIDANSVCALGCHGQTVRHRPNTNYSAHPFTLQLLDPSLIACQTGITTICDFRRKDMALGGEGAPLVPAFHRAVFEGNHQPRGIINIGGIANMTILRGSDTFGFDIGPGNALIDAWMQTAFNCAYDKNGYKAQKGTVNQTLLDALSNHPFLSKTPPKSTGREEFTLDWVLSHTAKFTCSDIDIVATLTELTAQCIAKAVQTYAKDCDIYLCGGGALNPYLYTRIDFLLGDNFNVQSTALLGVDPMHVEAMAFAWLAQQTLNQLPGNEPMATGASKKAILGGIYLP